MRNRLTKGMIVGMIGIDYSALKKTSENNVWRFLAATLFVVFILVISFFSVYYAFELMFHIWHVQILLSLFFSFMFGVIYVLLIQTFSKQPLAQKSRFRLNLSNILRGGFILFIGFLISKPLEIFILSESLDNDISSYKDELGIKFEKQTHAIYAADIKVLEDRKRRYASMGTSIPISYIQEVSSQLNNLYTQESSAIDKAHIRIEQSSFFLQRVRFAVNHYSMSWIICLIIITLFTIPAILVYTVSSNDRYYVNKREAEKSMVYNHYLQFNKLYTEVFADRFQIKNMVFYESHVDPPFRTERIPSPLCESEKEFFNRFKGYGLPEKLL